MDQEEEDLTVEQREIVRQFQEITQIESFETSVEILSNQNWNLEQATNNFFHSSSQPTTPIITEIRTNPEENLLNESQRQIVSRATNSVANHWFRNPLNFILNLFRKLFSFVPPSFIRVASTFFRSFFPRKIQRTPIEQIEEFCRKFDQNYGNQHPPFYRGLFSQALRDAQNEIRILFVFIHDEKSPNSDRFAREIICGEELQNQIGPNLLWSTSRNTAEGLAVSKLFHTNGFPCFCIIAHYGSQQTVLLKIENYIDRDLCLAEIYNGIQQADLTLEFNRAKKQSSEMRERLLQEQNDAYEQALIADREREQQRLEAETQRRELEAEEEKKRQKFVEFREKLRENLGVEPSENCENLVQVSIRLPSNETLRRRFKRDEPAKNLFEFAWTNENVPEKFVLFCGYPRKRYDFKSIDEKKISDLINVPKETCFLEEIEEEN